MTGVQTCALPIFDAKGYGEEAGLCTRVMDHMHKQDARIAALEAALKPFADKADKAEGPFEPPYPVDYPLWRAARACLNGDDK